MSSAFVAQARDAEYQIDVGIPARISREWICSTDQRQESARAAYRVTRAGRLSREDDLNTNLLAIGDYRDDLIGSKVSAESLIAIGESPTVPNSGSTTEEAPEPLISKKLICPPGVTAPT